MPSRIALACALATIPLLVVTGASTSARAANDQRVTIVRAPETALEGDRISLRIKVRAADTAKRVQLQERQLNIYRNYEWVTVRSRKAGGESRHDFTVTVDGLNTERYRAVVTYPEGRPARSKSVNIKVWRWIPFGNFDSYYATSGIADYPTAQFEMNGKTYRGWYTYGNYGSWEARYTPGRNCRAFRAQLGVRDESLDGSSGSISLLTDDGEVLFTSGALEPGMVEPVEIEIDRPYRLWVQATDTSPEDLWSLPSMGDPALLCTDI